MMIANSNGLVNTGEVDAKRRKEIEKGEGKKERKERMERNEGKDIRD